jgi:hypothetical protein
MSAAGGTKGVEFAVVERRTVDIGKREELVWCCKNGVVADWRIGSCAAVVVGIGGTQRS